MDKIAKAVRTTTTMYACFNENFSHCYLMYLRYDTTRLKFNYPKFFYLKMMTENWNQKHAGKYSSIFVAIFFFNIFIQYIFPKFSQRGFRSSVFYGSGAAFGSYWYEIWRAILNYEKVHSKIYIDHIDNNVNEARKIPSQIIFGTFLG